MAKKAPEKPVLKPVASIVKKRSWLVPTLSVIIILIVAGLLFYFVRPTTDKTILATVNGEPIYAEDIQLEYSRLPDQYKSQLTENDLLNQTIDKMLLLQEAENRGLTVEIDEVSRKVREIANEIGVEEEQLEAILLTQNVTMEQYRGIVEENLLLMKVIQDAITSRISVSDQEVVTYYEQHPEEFSAPEGGAVISHILVSNETVARELITQLGEGESFNDLAEQYSIDPGSANEGGYIGVVTEDSPLVEPFRTAALKLREGQYTRTPVQTEFGYHIILRNPDTEPLHAVRGRIKNQLETAKQQEAFKTLLDSLRRKAEIRYYTQKGVVTQAATDTSLDEFSTCVGERATLYGTSWSQFFQEQQALFGDSFAHVSYVDCDTKPHLCAAANIEKYPTWVIGDERHGKLSLKQLSEVTGCKLP